MLKSARNSMMAFLPVCAALFASGQLAQAQTVYPYGNYLYGNAPAANNQMGQIQSDAASGLLSPGQANSLMNQENSLASRTAKLLRNDGGVLTPADAAKLNRQSAQDQQRINNDIQNNTSGRTGLFGNLFGTTAPAYPYTSGLVPAANGLVQPINGYVPAVNNYVAPTNYYQSPYTTTLQQNGYLANPNSVYSNQTGYPVYHRHHYYNN